MQSDPLFFRELAKHGFLEGTNLTLDFRAGLDAELPRLATEIVTARPDAIFTIEPPTRAARESTSTIPIVMFGGEDAIFEGFAETLARPSANVTAVVIMSVQLEAKRLQLLHEAVSPPHGASACFSMAVTNPCGDARRKSLIAQRLHWD